MANMLDDNIKKQIQELFSALKEPVEILFFSSGDPERCTYCGETRQMLTEVSDISDLIHLQVFDIDENAALAQQYKVDGVPGFVLAGRDGEEIIDYGIRYKGVPAGHEFTSLVNDIVFVSQRDLNLSPETRMFFKRAETAGSFTGFCYSNLSILPARSGISPSICPGEPHGRGGNGGSDRIPRAGTPVLSVWRAANNDQYGCWNGGRSSA